MRVKNGYIDEGVHMSHPHQSLPSHCSISELSFFLSVPPCSLRNGNVEELELEGKYECLNARVSIRPYKWIAWKQKLRDVILND
ncbi:hypothetical protein HID58_082188 [Brassica napus]|nr:hypothetical protein HID58_082188 [Brassica napus]